jgi:hypothetical protein
LAYNIFVKNHFNPSINDYFTKLSLLVSSSHWKGRGKEREFTLPGNRQSKFVIKRERVKINIETSNIVQTWLYLKTGLYGKTYNLLFKGRPI